jgi:hypothetical protein
LAVPGLTRGADIKLNRRLPVATSYKSDTHHPAGAIFPNVRAHTGDSGDHTPLAGFVLEHVQMNHYRVVTVDYDGKLSRHRGFVCDNDDDAIVWAKQLVDEAPVELWSGARFVTRLEPRSNAKAR